MRTLNRWIEDTHRNAVAHGWWVKPVDDETMAALIVSEWSEALQEYREKKPALYYVAGKPEGVAVELIDGVIRILDYFGQRGITFEKEENGEERNMENAVDLARECTVIDEMDLRDAAFPIIVTTLIRYTVRGFDDGNFEVWLSAAMYLALWYIEEKLKAVPEEILETKHFYNINRPYRHGDKEC